MLCGCEGGLVGAGTRGAGWGGVVGADEAERVSVGKGKAEIEGWERHGGLGVLGVEGGLVEEGMEDRPVVKCCEICGKSSLA